MHSVLLDTGAFVALLDASEGSHERCVGFFKDFHGNLLTTEPVLTETLYLLNSTINAQKNCVEFILRSGAVLVPQSNESLTRAIVLMDKYKDIPMDFADATLVVLAEEMGIDEVFTLDKRGFSSYRINGKKVFKLWPE